MLLKDKVVIVSGIGPGLGQELSTLAAKEGASAVVLAARDTLAGDSDWLAVPVGVTLLVMIGLVRWIRRGRGDHGCQGFERQTGVRGYEMGCVDSGAFVWKSRYSVGRAHQYAGKGIGRQLQPPSRKDGCGSDRAEEQQPDLIEGD